MALLSVQAVNFGAGTPTLQAAAAGGDSFTAGVNTVWGLLVQTGTTATTLTINDPRTWQDDGTATFVPNATVTVAASSTRLIPLQGSRFTNGVGQITFTYSATTNVMVAALGPMPRAA